MIKLSILLMMMNGWNEDDKAFEHHDDCEWMVPGAAAFSALVHGWGLLVFQD